MKISTVPEFIRAVCALALLAGLRLPAADCAEEHRLYARSLVSHPLPAYPERALAAKKSGTVDLIISVDVSGLVVEAEPLGSRRGTGLTESAIRSVKTWRYNPVSRPDRDYLDIRGVTLEFDASKDPPEVRFEEGENLHLNFDDFQNLKLAHREEFVIPSELAPQVKESGRILAEMRVNARGEVTHACVIKSDLALLNDAVLATLKRWRYTSPRPGRGRLGVVFKTVTVRVEMR